MHPQGNKVAELIKKAIQAQNQNNWAEAEDLLSDILDLEPKHPEANYRMGCMALEAGYPDEALEFANTALEHPKPSAHSMKLKALVLQQLIRDCLTTEKWFNLLQYAQALSELNPQDAHAYGWIATAYMRLGQMDACRSAYAQRMRCSPKDPMIYSQWIALHAGAPQTDRQAYYQLAKKWDTDFSEAPPLPNIQQAKHERLRIGFVSSTFRSHANANFLLPLFRNLSAHSIDIYAYHDGTHRDSITKLFEAECHTFRSIAQLPLRDAARQIQTDSIDLLIDINGHFDSSRMRLYTYRPARIQAHYLGGTGALAMKSIDWRLADVWTEPEQEQTHSDDQIYRIEGGIHAFQPLSESAPLSPAPSLKNGYVTFGCLNGLHKIEVPTLRLWAQVLAACPNSRLVMIKSLFKNEANRTHFLKFATKHGLPEDRLDLRCAQDGESHADLSVYNSIDVALDTGPYNGITTTCEALWMGVPAVTYRGNRFVAREASALLHYAGYPQWIADDQTEYIKICQQLAATPKELNAIRPQVSRSFRSSSACDAKRLAKEFVKFFDTATTQPYQS